jgi:hypothetical protein
VLIIGRRERTPGNTSIGQCDWPSSRRAVRRESDGGDLTRLGICQGRRTALLSNAAPSVAHGLGETHGEWGVEVLRLRLGSSYVARTVDERASSLFAHATGSSRRVCSRRRTR